MGLVGEFSISAFSFDHFSKAELGWHLRAICLQQKAHLLIAEALLWETRQAGVSLHDIFSEDLRLDKLIKTRNLTDQIPR